MRAAPAVQATLPPDPGWSHCVRGLAALTAAAWAAWGASWAWPQGGAWGAAMLASVAALVAWVALGRVLVDPQAGQLRWDGAAWSWQAAGTEAPRTGTLAPRLDLGGWMLLRWRPADGGAALWLPVSRRACAGGWTALRAAVWARGVAEQ